MASAAANLVMSQEFMKPRDDAAAAAAAADEDEEESDKEQGRRRRPRRRRQDVVKQMCRAKYKCIFTLLLICMFVTEFYLIYKEIARTTSPASTTSPAEQTSPLPTFPYLPACLVHRARLFCQPLNAPSSPPPSKSGVHELFKSENVTDSSDQQQQQQQQRNNETNATQFHSERNRAG